MDIQKEKLTIQESADATGLSAIPCVITNAPDSSILSIARKIRAAADKQVSKETIQAIRDL